jgi:hypothetical protein
MAAAPKACTTSKVSSAASRPSDGAIRIPVRAANIDPMSQEARRTRMALVPLRSTRLGSSTTARMAAPSRVSRTRRYSPRAPTAATVALKICWLSTRTPWIRTPPSGRNGGKGRVSKP